MSLPKWRDDKLVEIRYIVFLNKNQSVAHYACPPWRRGIQGDWKFSLT